MTAAQSIQPSGFARRSFVYRGLVAAGARFAEMNGAAIALDFGAPEAEAARARRLGLADLSPLPRVGFKGRGTAEWLSGQGIVVPEESNRAARQADGALTLRLAPGEVLILGDPGGESGLPGRLKTAWAGESRPPKTPRGYPVPRDESHAWFLVTGEHGAAMFAKLCAVDLRAEAFPDGRIAQTSLARLNAIIVRDDRAGRGGDVAAFHVLADSASADYLWGCLLDAMAEFDGGPVGLSALRAL